MSKILLTRGNVGEYVRDNKIFIEKNMILSSGAKDLLIEKGVEIQYNKTSNCKDELSKELSIEEKIRKILRENFGIVNNEEIVGLVMKKLNGGMR